MVCTIIRPFRIVEEQGSLLPAILSFTMLHSPNRISYVPHASFFYCARNQRSTILLCQKLRQVDYVFLIEIVRAQLPFVNPFPLGLGTNGNIIQRVLNILHLCQFISKYIARAVALAHGWRVPQRPHLTSPLPGEGCQPSHWLATSLARVRKKKKRKEQKNNNNNNKIQKNLKKLFTSIRR